MSAESYARRVAEAAARGRTGQDLYGKAQRAASSSSATPRVRAVAAARRQLSVPRRQTVGDTTVTNTISRTGFLADVRQAAADGQYVSVTVTANGGSGWRTRTLTAASFGRVSDGGPQSNEGGGESGGGELGRKVQATYGPSSAFTGGTAVPAADLLDYLDLYDDPWDALYDWWEEEYL